MFRTSECASTDRDAGLAGARPLFSHPRLGKLAAIFFLAAWFARYEKPQSNVLFGLILPLAIISLPAGLVLGEVDLGTTALIGTTAFVVMFVAGANLLWLGAVSFAGLSASFSLSLHKSPNEWGGSPLFFQPGKFQRRRWIAADAGVDRLGQRRNGRASAAHGRQKMLYLPYAHTDFIFPIIGEELGLRFSLLVVFFVRGDNCLRLS